VAPWTNASVRALAGHSDPVAAIREAVRRVIIAALEAGWRGPPFDPFELAALRGIDCAATESVPEARVVPRTRAMVIEFNPNRPRRRVRFSVAHEIAHTLFPDCADLARNRLGDRDDPGDGWQLEMLCNLAASEFLMPTGDDLGPEAEPTVDNLIALQTKFDVSMEAIAIRLAHVTSLPCTILVAARVDETDLSQGFRVDYALSSRSSRLSLQAGSILRGQVFCDCTAVGYTSKGTERLFPGEAPLYLECVGLSPYRGSALPRVLAVARSPVQDGFGGAQIRFLKGNALDFRRSGPTILAHIVNDQAVTWVGEFANGLHAKFPEAQEQFRSWTSAAKRHLILGSLHLAELGKGRFVASLVAQHGYGPSPTPRVRYGALRDCLRALATEAKSRKAAVQMPRIGTGMAGGNWGFIQELVDESLVREGVPVTVFTLPGRNLTGGKALGGATHRLDEAFPAPDGG
jgi:hypothetical protein